MATNISKPYIDIVLSALVEHIKKYDQKHGLILFEFDESAADEPESRDHIIETILNAQEREHMYDTLCQALVQAKFIANYRVNSIESAKSLVELMKNKRKVRVLMMSTVSDYFQHELNYFLRIFNGIPF